MPPHRPRTEQDGVERRIRAAIALAGIDFAELARRIDTRNLGVRTLRALNETRKPMATRLHLEAIARACGLPYDFFTVDFARLAELTHPEAATRDGDAAEPLDHRVDSLRADLELLAAEVRRLAAASDQTNQGQAR